MGNHNLSPIFPLNLQESSGFSYNSFVFALQLLAKKYGLEAKVFRHNELSDGDLHDLVRLLELNNDKFIREEIRKNDNLENRIYVQLKARSMK
jgi:hypothetical protein